MTESGKRNQTKSVGKVLWHVTMSLDGFIASPDDSVEWGLDFFSDTPNPVANQVMNSIGAILAGRRWYDALDRVGGFENIYGGEWTGPVFVITHQPPASSKDKPVTFLSDDIETAVATVLAAANGKDIVLFGTTIPRQCLAAGLLDDIVIHLVPILLGEGIRLYGVPGDKQVKLESTYMGQSGQVTDLRFHVVR